MTTAQTTPVVAVVLAAGSGLRFDPANPNNSSRSPARRSSAGASPRSNATRV